VWKESDHYVAQCLNVDISSFGETKTDALKNLKEALALFFEDSNVEIGEIKEPEIVATTVQYA